MQLIELDQLESVCPPVKTFRIIPGTIPILHVCLVQVGCIELRVRIARPKVSRYSLLAFVSTSLSIMLAIEIHRLFTVIVSFTIKTGVPKVVLSTRLANWCMPLLLAYIVIIKPIGPVLCLLPVDPFQFRIGNRQSSSIEQMICRRLSSHEILRNAMFGWLRELARGTHQIMLQIWRKENSVATPFIL